MFFKTIYYPVKIKGGAWGSLTASGLLFFSFSVLLTSRAHAAQPYRYEITPAAVSAYTLVVGLRFSEAREAIQQLKTSDQRNLISGHLDNYIDCLSVYISEDESALARLKRRKSDRMGMLQQGNAQSPYYRYAQANVRLQWAMAHLKFGEYFTAFAEVSKALRLLRQNEELFPDFLPNKKDMALLQAAAGVIPDQFKWGVKMLTGLDGNIAQARKSLEQILLKSKGNHFLFETETRVYYAFLLLHLSNDPEAAWQAVGAGQLKPDQNPVHCFIVANIAMRSGRNDQAIALLSQCPRGDQFHPLPFIDQMMGMAKLRRLDRDAQLYFQRFLKMYPGRNFIKDTYQKLAWHALIFGESRAYHQYMRFCQERGYAGTGSDRSALREADMGLEPNLVLLKARLLFDGGYYQRALDLLGGAAPLMLDNERHRVEFAYRKGRILHSLGRRREAIAFYESALQQGSRQGFFFACNACLQLGLIYEQQGQTERASTYFQRCLGLASDEYETELHQKAKAGLNRIKYP